MLKRHSYKFIKNFFENNNCVLLTKEYKNTHTPMPYICSCGNKSQISFNNFRKGKRCRNCGENKSPEYEFVKNFFKDNGCQLLAKEYNNAYTLMPYVCSCGNKSQISWDNFKRGCRCKKCSGKEKLTYFFVKKFFYDNGCKLLATKYRNSKELMPYICCCGNKSQIKWDHFKSGHRCSKCGGTEKLTYEYVKQFFEDNGCKLLATEYHNSNTLMPYICSCGNKSQIIWDSFKNGTRCMKCGGSEKLTYEYVKQFFKDNGCKLLAAEYHNNRRLMPYICKCGNKSKINWSNFKNGRRCSKCRQSNGEKLVEAILIKLNKDFERQYTFSECKNKRRLPFDFGILKNKKLIGLIEYNGIQHYEPVCFGSSDINENFKRTTLNDNIKQKFCTDNGIPLLIIPYWEKNINNAVEDFFQTITRMKLISSG